MEFFFSHDFIPCESNLVETSLIQMTTINLPGTSIGSVSVRRAFSQFRLNPNLVRHCTSTFPLAIASPNPGPFLTADRLTRLSLGETFRILLLFDRREHHS